MLTVEIAELIECRKLREKASGAVTVLMLEHQCVSRGKTVLILCVEELIERPPHILFVFGEWFIFFVPFGSQNRNVLIGQVQAQIVPYSLLADIVFICYPGDNQTPHLIIRDKGEYPGNDGLAVMYDLSCGGIQRFNIK